MGSREAWNPCSHALRCRSIVADALDQKKWNRLIAFHIRQGHAKEALQTFWQMEQEGVEPNEVTFANVFKACAGLGALEHGRHVHMRTHERKPKKNRVVANSMLNMYAKCGELGAAVQLFEEMPKKNLISWNSLITGYVQHGNPTEAFNLFREMQSEGIKPNEMTHVSILKACTSLGLLEDGQLIHAHIIKQGYEHNSFLANTVIDMYSKCGCIEDAWQVFDELPRRDVVSWTTMITGYVNDGLAEEALDLFQQMHWEGVQPNRCTFVSILNGCASMGDLEIGKWIHNHIRKTECKFDNIVGSALINMYAKCGSIECAQEVFEMMPRENAIPWTMMITALVHHGDVELALKLYGRMRRENINPDTSTFVTILKARVGLHFLNEIKEMHSHMVQSNLESNVFVGSSLVDIYAKLGSIEDAFLVFNRMPNRDVVSWTVMIAGYAHHAEDQKALSLFWQMQTEGVKPNELTFVTVLDACTNQASLEEGRQIHSYVIMSGFESHVSVGNSIIDLYVKGGSIEEARLIFEAMPERNFVSWTAIIGGYGQHGCGTEALQLLHKMQLEGLVPDGVTFTGVLSACSHDGLVEEGFYYFDSMNQDHGITPTDEHYSCMVDLLGRMGCLEEAEEFIRRSPIEPSAVMWMSLLSACAIHGSVETAQKTTACILKLEPQNTAASVLLSNMCAATGLQKITGG